MTLLSFQNSLPPVVGRLAALIVGIILLNGFLFHKALWRAGLGRKRNRKAKTIPAVLVTVFSEALSPECRDFFVETLTPLYQRLGPTVIDLHVIPFGGSELQTTESGTLAVSCPHGPAECDLHTYEQCVILSQYPDPMRYLGFVNCLYKRISSDSTESERLRGVAKCAKRHDLSFTTFASCHDDPNIAVVLQRKASSLTPEEVTSVPWLEVGGERVIVPSDNTWETSLEELVCRKYMDGGGRHRHCNAYLRDKDS